MERTIRQTKMEKELTPKSMVVDGFVLKAVKTKFFLPRRKPEEAGFVSERGRFLPSITQIQLSGKSEFFNGARDFKPRESQACFYFRP